MCHCFISLAHLEAAGAWSQLEDFKDPELQRLALGVPNMLLSGKADSTTKKYKWRLSEMEAVDRGTAGGGAFLLKRPM